MQDNIYFGIIIYDLPKNISYKNGEYDDFENIIPEAEFGIFVLTILNGYKSEVILDKLVQVIQESLGEREDVGK